MKNELSYVINNVVIFVEGLGFMGTGNYTAPELKFKRVECSGAAGAYMRSFGMTEEIEASCKFTVTNEVLYKALMKQDSASLIFSSANETGNAATGRREVLTGSFDVKENEAKNGEALEVELSIHATYWLKEVGGKPMVEIDKLQNIVKINGKDLLEETRKVVS